MIDLIRRDIFPSEVNSKYPAIIFAANCTVNVPSRIIFLIVSIHTINGIRIGGELKSDVHADVIITTLLLFLF